MSAPRPATMQRPAPVEDATRRLSPDEAAHYAGTRRRYLLDAARRRELSCIVYRRGRDGRATVVAFDVRDLDAWIEAHRQEARR